MYLGDLPNTNRIDGSLFFFTVPSVNSNSPTIIRRNVGTINYKKGVITINPVNILAGKIKDGQPIIEISASPASNDVVGLQDLYLQLDISNSTFDTVVDSISSGLDPSASTYISSSSYANGALVRETGDLGTVNTDGLSTNVTNRTIATTTTTTTTSTTGTTTTTTTTTPSSTGSTGSSGSASGGGHSGSGGGSGSSGGGSSYSY